MGVLSCVSIIAQSRVIDKAYLIIRLHNVLWNCYFLSQLLFQNLYFLKVLSYTILQELLFQRMQFFRTANLEQVTSWSFKTSKFLGGSQSGALLRNISIKYHDQNLCLIIVFSFQHWTGQSIEEWEKFSFLRELNKNINFSTKFHY